MNENLLKLEPKALWANFAELTKIPRPSKKEERIIEFMKQFGEGLGLETIVDKVGNVIIKKPATPGMENRKGIIMQGHLDMVPQKNSDKVHDFATDPIETIVDGEWVKANGTTLGSDNGIGCAAAMTVLASKNLQHGPVEALFTIDEETGMTGAFELQSDVLDGDILLNLDSEDEGELYVGCAGGEDITAKYKFGMENADALAVSYKLTIKGLKGGHSGLDIKLGRGNANKLMFRFFYANENLGIRIANYEGGNLRNAIPREAFATVTVPANHAAEFEKAVTEFNAVYKHELSGTEPDLKFFAERIQLPAKVMDAKAQQNVIRAVYGCPNGVIRMSDSMHDLVETSTNLAIVKVENESAFIACLMRSSVDSAKTDLGYMIKSVFELSGAEVAVAGAYPGWKPNMESPILKTMQKVYEDKFGKTPEIKAIHAGLECGLLGGVYPNWDMISFGPTIRFPHSPDEKVHIASVQKFWDYLVETLKHVPEKQTLPAH